MFGVDKAIMKVYEKAKQDLKIFITTQGEEFIQGKKLVVTPTITDGKPGVAFSLEDK